MQKAILLHKIYYTVITLIADDSPMADILKESCITNSLRVCLIHILTFLRVLCTYIYPITQHRHGNDVYQIPDFLRLSRPNDAPHVEIYANISSTVSTMHIPSLVEKTFSEAALQIKSGTATGPTCADVSVISSAMTEITPSIVPAVPTMAVAPIRKALKAPNKRQSIMMQTQPENWFGDY